MAQLNAFVARSFDSHDEQRIRPVLAFLETFQKAGFFCQTAEAAEVESVSKKVRKMIDEREVFIGFFTRRDPAYIFNSKIQGAWQVLCGKTEPESWSAPDWVLQESGYALRGEKKLILLKETGVKVPGLQGDLEYVPFDPNCPAEVFSKLSQMINGLLAEAAGITVSMTLTERKEQSQVAAEPTVSQIPAEAPKDAVEEPDFSYRIGEMFYAADQNDLEGVVEAWKAGSELIADAKAGGRDRIAWDSLYFQCRFTANAIDALEDLKRLRDRYPDRYEPKKAMAHCYYESKEYDSAASLFLEVAGSQEGQRKARNLVLAAQALQETKRYDEAIDAVKAALPIVPDSLRDEAIALHYQLLKERGDDYLAFAAAEVALHENPRLPVRFILGLDYRLKSLNELALYHFKFLYDSDNKNSSALHNVALLSADCKLPVSAVARYKAAFTLGETLSAANLGHIYLNSGMADDAKALINEAMKTDNHVPAVEKCLAEIVQRQESENERETEILKQAADTRSFFLDMGRALSAPTPGIDGIWKLPFAEMPLTVISGKLHGTAEVERQESGFGFLLGKVGAQLAKTVDTYVLSGQLTGAVCEFNVTVGERGEHGIAGMLLGNRPTKFGFIVFASDVKSARYVELSDSKLGKIETVERRKSLV